MLLAWSLLLALCMGCSGQALIVLIMLSVLASDTDDTQLSLSIPAASCAAQLRLWAALLGPPITPSLVPKQWQKGLICHDLFWMWHALLQVAVKPPMAVTNAVSWRSEGIKYKKNEVFLDVVESVNLLVNSNGTVVRSEVVGALKMRTFLSGMPECKLGLNDKVVLLAMHTVDITAYTYDHSICRQMHALRLSCHCRCMITAHLC